MIPSIQDVQTNWSAFAEAYSTILEKGNLNLGLSLTRMLRVDTAQNILEVGCGSGRLALHLLQNLPEGIKFTSIDLADEMISIANKRKEENASILKKIDHQFLQGNAEDLSSIPSESVDVVFLPLVLHLTPNPDKAVQEAMRVLKKGGRIGFSVLGNPEESTFFSIMGKRLQEFKSDGGPQKRDIFYLGNREDLIKLAERNGVKVDFCWNEYVAMAVLEENEVGYITDAPPITKFLNTLNEDVRTKFKESLRNDFREMKKKHLPLLTHNTLLIGRKE